MSEPAIEEYAAASPNLRALLKISEARGWEVEMREGGLAGRSVFIYFPVGAPLWFTAHDAADADRNAGAVLRQLGVWESDEEVEK